MERNIEGQVILISTTTTGFWRFSISKNGDYLLVFVKLLRKVELLESYFCLRLTSFDA